MKTLCLDQMLKSGEQKGDKQTQETNIDSDDSDFNLLGTTIVYKYKIDHVKSTVTRKCRLCLR